MIYFIDTENLMRKYSKRPVSEIDSANYLIFSSHILNTEPRNNVLNVYSTFMSLDTLKGVNALTDVHSLKAREEFKGYLLKQPKIMLFLVELILNDITSSEDTFFIVTPSEKNGNIKIFADAIYDLFKYRIKEYPEEDYINPEEVVERIDYYKEEATALAFDLEPVYNKAELLKVMGKKDIKKLMKRKGLTYHGLERDEMISLLLEG